MKIAYLMHYMKNNFEEITENLDILINQGDDVYLMVNDDDLRDDLILSYCDTPNLHVAHHQQTALPADMSLPRGFIVLMKDALEFEKEDGSFTYDRFIIMTDGMIPTKSKAQLVEYLETHEDEDIYYEVDNSDENVEVKKRFENYAFFTNSYDFQKSKTIRAMNKMTSSLVHSFKKREIEDTIYISYPWFILTHESAKALADNLAYCSNTFKMCLYPEEMAIATMLHKFSNVDHHNENIWAVGKNGEYILQQPMENVELDLVLIGEAGAVVNRQVSQLLQFSPAEIAGVFRVSVQNDDVHFIPPVCVSPGPCGPGDSRFHWKVSRIAAVPAERRTWRPDPRSPAQWRG